MHELNGGRALWSLALLVLALGGGSDAAAAAGPYFERVATFPVYLNLPEGSDPASETVAEIVAATPDGMTLVYTDSPGARIGLVDIREPAAPEPAGTIALGGEPTSVTVVQGLALAGVNTSESFTEPSGHVAVVDLASGQVAATCDVHGQPDSVAASPDGAFLAVAVENERDEDLDDGIIPQLPPGHLAILELDADGRPSNCGSARLVELTGIAEIAPEAPEPEFVDVNADNLAVVTLQENNHIVLVDLPTGEVVGHFSAGVVDLAGIDVEEDGIIQGTGALEAVKREPDGVAWLDGDRLVTANEGDYEGGSRGFTIFDRAGTVLYDSGNLLEHLAISHGHYPEERSENRGVEPEAVVAARYGEELLLFVSAERGNFIAVFRDRGGESEPEYIQFLPAAVGPEGLLALPERDLFVVASEEDSEEDGVRAAITIYARTAETALYPTIVSDNDPATGAPIGWGALSGLAADPADPNRIHAVSDGFYAVSRIFTLDVSKTPARITGYVDLAKDGAPAGYDLEGIAPRASGGFWLAAEGDPKEDDPLRERSLLLQVATDGTVEREIALPEALYEHATASGFEGVAARWEGDQEEVILAIQRPWKDDPEHTTKLAIYSPAADSWSFVRYPLEAPKSDRGGWVGLSEITWLGDGRLAVLERDNQPGDYAAIKTLVTVSLDGVEPRPLGEDLPVVEKEVVLDLLPVLLESKGWISDKPEGFAVTSDGRAFLVTDNDGVDGASGETLLLPLGSIEQLF